MLEQSGHIDSQKTGFRSHDIYHYYPFKKPDPNGVVVGGESTRFGVLTDNDMRKQGYKRKVRLLMVYSHQTSMLNKYDSLA